MGEVPGRNGTADSTHLEPLPVSDTVLPEQERCYCTPDRETEFPVSPDQECLRMTGKCTDHDIPPKERDTFGCVCATNQRRCVSQGVLVHGVVDERPDEVNRRWKATSKSVIA